MEITQLPNVLDEDSIRVDGIGGQAMIADVIYHPPTSNDADKKHQDAVKELTREKDILVEKKAILSKQTRTLEKFAETLTGEHTTAAKLEEYLDIYQARQTKIDAETRELDENIKKLDDSIEEERKSWSVDDSSKTRAARITVVVTALEDGAAELTLTYSKHPAPQIISPLTLI